MINAPLNGIVRVLMITSFPVDIQNIKGGIQAVAYNLSKGLLKMGVDLHILTSKYKTEYFECLKKRKIAYFNFDKRIKIYLHKHRKFPSLTNCFLYIALIGKIKNINPDIIHVQQSGWGTLIANLSGYPNVTTIHGIQTKEVKLRRDIYKIGKELRILYENALLRKIQNVIIINKYVCKKIRFSPRTNLFFINNPIKNDFFKLERDPTKQRLLFPNGVRERKDIVTLLKMVKILKRELPLISVNITGHYLEKNYFNKIIQLIRKYDLSDNVKILGVVSEKRLFEEYSKADMLVMSSVEETSPMVIQQAMACGLPIVSTRAGGIPYMIEHKKNGLLVEIGDAEGLANMAKLLFKDEALKNEIVKNARIKAERAYSLDSIARQTINVYKEVIRSHYNGALIHSN